MKLQPKGKSFKPQLPHRSHKNNLEIDEDNVPKLESNAK
jgi:hypothetical protein